MKKVFCLIIAAALTLTACSRPDEPASDMGDSPPSAAENEKISVVTTIFPQYDFARAIAGDNAEVTMLLPPAAESHSYEPTPRDIMKVQECDAFIYVGGESEQWVEDVLESVDTNGKKIITLIDCVDAVEEEIVEGMEDDEDHDDEDFDDDDVKDRALSDWAGEWKSAYPYLLDGTLDPYLEKLAEEDGTKTAEDFRARYDYAYNTDADKVTIDDSSITYYVNGVANKTRYEYGGFKILLNESGQKRVRYQFDAVGETNGAPRYIEFSDHLIAPGEEIEHFHLYRSDEGHDALSEEWERWPTYYPAAYTGDDILEELTEGGEEPAYDEHVWTSPKNAKLIVQRLSDAFCEIDAANAETYRSNADAYSLRLDEIDAKFQSIVDGAARKTIVFGDRFPFRYFADAYGLDYYAAFPGCSTETEPSAATVRFLIDKINEERIPAVFHIELSNKRMAETISEATGAEVLELHACHNISKDDFASGANYLDIMTRNAENLQKALS